MDTTDHDDTTTDGQDPPGLTKVGRRALLGAASLGTFAAASVTGLAANPATATAKPRAQAARVPYPDNLPLLSGPDLPIGLYWPPPPFQTSPERYAEIAEAGFTFIAGGNYIRDPFILRRALQSAQAAGLGYLEADDSRLLATMRLTTLTDSGAGELEFSTAEATRLIRSLVDEFRSFSSFSGINFFDEPTAQVSIDNVARGIKILRQVAPNLLPYVNLERGISANPARLAAFIEQVDPPMISFDHYPLFKGSVDQSWFADWASVRQAGLTYNLPTWTYLLAVEHLNYRSPNLAELLWQTNVSLAYGCKGILYFTYWTPDVARGEDFTVGAGALMTVDGKRTPRYDYAKTINTTWLPQVGRQLKPLTSQAIGIANLLDYPPGGLPAFEPGELIAETWGDPLVIGQFGAAGKTQRWFLVVNWSMDATATGRVNFGSGVSRVDRFEPGTESYRRVNRQVDISLAPGAAVLLRVAARS